MPSNLPKHCLAANVIMSEHAILELVNSVSNSFEYYKFTPGIPIIYFSKVLDTQSYYIVHYAEVDLEEGRGRPPFFRNHLFFCNHFEDLQTVLIKVKLIINNAPLRYVYPNTIKTCLTLNHLLFGRQSSYCSNTTSTVVRSLTVLSSTTGKIKHISNHLWHRWRHEYVLLNLRETQRTSKLNIKEVLYFRWNERHLRACFETLMTPLQT